MKIQFRLVLLDRPAHDVPRPTWLRCSRTNCLRLERSSRYSRASGNRACQSATDCRDLASGEHLGGYDRADSTIANVNSTIDQLRDPIRQDLAELQSTMQQAKSLIGSLQVVVQSNDDNGQTASLESGENPAAEGSQSASVAIRQSGRRHRNVSFRTD
jgi:hypothetical protein